MWESVCVCHVVCVSGCHVVCPGVRGRVSLSCGVCLCACPCLSCRCLWLSCLWVSCVMCPSLSHVCNVLCCCTLGSGISLARTCMSFWVGLSLLVPSSRGRPCRIADVVGLSAAAHSQEQGGTRVPTRQPSNVGTKTLPSAIPSIEATP